MCRYLFFSLPVSKHGIRLASDGAETEVSFCREEHFCTNAVEHVVTAVADVYSLISERKIGNSMCWSSLTVPCYHGNARCYVKEVWYIMTMLSGINPNYRITFPCIKVRN